MNEFICYLKSDIYKLMNSCFFLLHIIIPTIGVILMILFAIFSGSSDVNKLAAFTQIIAAVFPVIISIICTIVIEQEIDAGGCQNILTLPCRKSVILSKFTLLVFSGLFSCLLCTMLYGWGFSYIKNFDIPFLFYIVIPVSIWASNVYIYVLQLIFTFQFGTNVGICLGVIGSLVTVLMHTGLGDGLWYVVPYGSGVRLIDVVLRCVIMSKIELSGEEWLGIDFCIGMTCAIIVLMIFWFSKYSGLKKE